MKSMSPEVAQTIALKALGWIIARDDLRDTFLGSTGMAVSDLASSAEDSTFQASVLEFLTMDDAWVTGFCDEVALTYDQPLKARYALPGAEQVHWT